MSRKLITLVLLLFCTAAMGQTVKEVVCEEDETRILIDCQGGGDTPADCPAERKCGCIGEGCQLTHDYRSTEGGEWRAKWTCNQLNDNEADDCGVQPAEPAGLLEVVLTKVKWEKKLAPMLRLDDKGWGVEFEMKRGHFGWGIHAQRSEVDENFKHKVFINERWKTRHGRSFDDDAVWVSVGGWW